MQIYIWAELCYKNKNKAILWWNFVSQSQSHRQYLKSVYNEPGVEITVKGYFGKFDLPILHVIGLLTAGSICGKDY